MSVGGIRGGEPIQKSDDYNIKPTAKTVKKELRELGKFIDSSIRNHNVKSESLQNAKDLRKIIKNTLQDNNEEFLTSRHTLLMIQQIRVATKGILIKDTTLETEKAEVNPDPATVKKELQDLAKLISSELTRGNVKTDKVEDAKQLLGVIRSTLKSENEEALSDNQTLALVKLLQEQVPNILIKK
ncbi:MAG: hypothetical protein ACXU9U_02285 [Parachlamydiaceae bacterium]